MADDAEICFMQSLDCSRRHGRARMGVAHRDRSGERCGPLRAAPEAARAVLQPVFEQFVEGFDTADLKAAGRLLATLG